MKGLGLLLKRTHEDRIGVGIERVRGNQSNHMPLVAIKPVA
jgi:hypothetical protein